MYSEQDFSSFGAEQPVLLTLDTVDNNNNNIRICIPP